MSFPLKCSPVLFLLLFVPVKASFIFEVTVQSYSNPNGKLVDGSDCDVFTDCDPYYETFCLREAGHSESDREHCPLGSNGSDEDDTHGFSRTIESALPWPGAFQLYIFMREGDAGSDDDLARIFAESVIKPGSEISAVQSFTGDHVTLGLQFQVTCQSDFYGENCTTFCQPRDDTSGHYTCSESGAVECLTGYQNPDNDCIDAICMEGCNTTGGYCDVPGECRCREGWNGTLCDQEINVCGEFPCQNGGSCTPNGTVNYTCTCPPGVEGVNCEEDTYDGCRPNPCQNDGNCTDSAPGEMYTCNCPFGFGDDNCTTDTVDSCLSNPCTIEEMCTDLIEGYNCTCLPGLTGENCTINIDDCVDVQCQDNAVCVDDIDSYNCVCQLGFELEGPNCVTVGNGNTDSQSDGGDDGSTGIIAGAVVGAFVLLICILLLILAVVLILRRRKKKAPADDILLKAVHSKPHPYDTCVSPTGSSSNTDTSIHSPPPPPPSKETSNASEPLPHQSSLADNPLYGQTSPGHDESGGVPPNADTVIVSPDALFELDNPLYEPGGGNHPSEENIYSEPNVSYETVTPEEPSAYAYARLKDSDKSEAESKAPPEGYTILGTTGVSKGEVDPYGKLDHTKMGKDDQVRRLATEEGSGYDALF